MTGYSGTPLAKKLGIRAASRVRITGAPENFEDLLSPLPDQVQISKSIRKDIDIWHFFTKSTAELRTQLPKQLKAIKQDGIIWVS